MNTRITFAVAINVLAESGDTMDHPKTRFISGVQQHGSGSRNNELHIGRD